VAQVTARRCPIPIEFIGLQDRYAESGPYETLLDRYGMSVEEIADAAQRAIANKVRKVHL